MSRCLVPACMPEWYLSATTCPSCSTTNPSVYVAASTSATVAILPSSRVREGSPRDRPDPGSGPGAAARMSWLGISSRTCWNAHRLNGGSCQLASVTCASGAGGKPVMSGIAPSREATGVVGSAPS